MTTAIKKLSNNECAELYQKAHKAGMEAGKAANPTPMVVRQHASTADDSSPVIQSWHVPEGVCGFAWVNIRPANCRFANWCRKEFKGSNNSYSGGLDINADLFGQSYDRKCAYAQAFAEVLRDAGINANVQSRLD